MEGLFGHKLRVASDTFVRFVLPPLLLQGTRPRSLKRVAPGHVVLVIEPGVRAFFRLYPSVMLYLRVGWDKKEGRTWRPGKGRGWQAKQLRGWGR
jgi:hypothetical protein